MKAVMTAVAISQFLNVMCGLTIGSGRGVKSAEWIASAVSAEGADDEEEEEEDEEEEEEEEEAAAEEGAEAAGSFDVREGEAFDSADIVAAEVVRDGRYEESDAKSAATVRVSSQPLETTQCNERNVCSVNRRQ